MPSIPPSTVFSSSTKIFAGERINYSEPRIKANGRDSIDLQVHDLRRSAHYQMRKAGIDSKTRRAIMGHKTGSMDDRYTVIDDEAFDDAIDKMNAYQKRQGMISELKELYVNISQRGGAVSVRTAALKTFYARSITSIPEAKSSDRASNLTLAYQGCNQAKNNRDIREFVQDKTRLQKIVSQAQAPLRDAAAINATRWKLFEVLESTRLPLEVGTGGRPKFNRSQLGLPKAHWIDAACIGKSGESIKASPTLKPLSIQRLANIVAGAHFKADDPPYVGPALRASEPESASAPEFGEGHRTRSRRKE